MFQFTPFPSMAYVLGHGCMRIAACGFPHSDICGSKDMCSSPQLFAAYHVLLRLPVPRHPPDALVNLTFACASVMRRSSSLLSVSEFSGFSTNSLDESLPSIFIAYLDSLSICFLLVCYSIFKVRSFYIKKDGGEYRARTCDPLRARQVLSQLS